MNSGLTTMESEVYVHINPGIANQLHNNGTQMNNVEDVHICGACKQSFPDINLFVEHKRSSCSASPQTTLATIDVSLGRQTLSYIPSNRENDTSSPDSAFLRVIFDGNNVPVSLHRTVDVAEQDPLQSFLSLPYKKGWHGSRNQGDTNTDLDGIQNTVLQRRPRKESKEDEDDVAVLLANHFVSEDVTNVNSSGIPSSSADLELESARNKVVSQNPKEMFFSENDEGKQNNVVHLRSDITADLTYKTTKARAKEAVGESPLHTDKLWSQPTDSYIIPDITVENMSEDDDVDIISVDPPVNKQNASQIKTENATDTLMPYANRVRKKHMCQIMNCSFTAYYVKDLVRHMRTHTGEKPFQCSYCSSSFSRYDKLRTHMRIHSGDKPHKCQICNYATVDSATLKKHMRVHNDERPYKCQICSYRSRDSSQLVVHLRTHTGDHPFACQYENCTSSFKTSSDLKRHHRVHTGEKPYSCDLCGYRCAIKSNLAVHVRLNHVTEDLIPCTVCNHVAVSRRAAKQHEKVHAGKLQNTLKKKHSEPKHPKKSKGNGRGPTGNNKGVSINSKGVSKGRGRTSNSLKPYCVRAHKCTKCDAAFVREDSWRCHMRQHQKIEDASNYVPEDETAMSAHILAQKNAEAHLHEETSLHEEIVLHQTETISAELNANTLNNNSGRSGDKTVPSDEFVVIHSDGKANNDDNFVNSNKHSPLNSEEKEDFGSKSFLSNSREVSSCTENPCNKKLTKIPHKETENNGLHTQPVFLYVQNPPISDDNVGGLHNAEILASLNQPGPILLGGRSGQYLSITPDNTTLIEQISLQSGMQYVISDGLVGTDATFIQTSDCTSTSSAILNSMNLSAVTDSIHGKSKQ